MCVCLRARGVIIANIITRREAQTAEKLVSFFPPPMTSDPSTCVSRRFNLSLTSGSRLGVSRHRDVGGNIRRLLQLAQKIARSSP